MEKNETEAYKPGPGRPKKLSEIDTGGVGIEPVDNMNSIELEQFMNEEVLIYLHQGRDMNDLDVVVANVNGINQPLIRGQEALIKRKYVESLARCHTIKYEQQVQNPMKPENIQMLERKIASYPFDVRRDTAKGKEWLKSIYASI